jgi:hypothetical protein
MDRDRVACFECGKCVQGGVFLFELLDPVHDLLI